jgi:hypothetical protein
MSTKNRVGAEKSMNIEETKLLADLYQQKQDIETSMMTTRDFKLKRKLEEEKGKIWLQICELETKIQHVKEKEAEKTLETLVKENRVFIFVSANGKRLEISEKLEVELVFEPCKHRETIKVMELLRNPQYPSNTNLLDHWQRLLSEDSTITTMRLCEQCQKDRESLKAKLGFWQPERPIGRANLVLRRLQ